MNEARGEEESHWEAVFGVPLVALRQIHQDHLLDARTIFLRPLTSQDEAGAAAHPPLPHNHKTAQGDKQRKKGVCEKIQERGEEMVVRSRGLCWRGKCPRCTLSK